MSAIEEIQVNIAPYDVRQGHFVGAGVNSVTRAATTSSAASAYYWFRDDSLVGTEAKDATVNPGTFDFKKYGRLGLGPDRQGQAVLLRPARGRDARSSRARRSGPTPAARPVGGNVTRVLASDLDALSSYLSSNFGYDTGAYQDYRFETPARRYLAKLDYNVNDRNKISLRYIQLDSNTDVLVSNSSSLGFGSRRSNTTGPQLPELELHDPREHPVVHRRVELDHRLEQRQHADRRLHEAATRAAASLDDVVPDGGHPARPARSTPRSASSRSRRTTSCATRPSRSRTTSPNRGNHTLTFGASAERYESENVFFPGSQSAYVYNSLADFYTDANDYLANPNRTTSPVTLRRFQVRWMNIPGLDKPIQPLEVWYTGVYAQDEWQVNRQLQADLRPAHRRPVLRRHRLHERRGRRAHVPGRERQPASSTRPGSCPTPTSCGRRASASTGT